MFGVHSKSSSKSFASQILQNLSSLKECRCVYRYLLHLTNSFRKHFWIECHTIGSGDLDCLKPLYCWAEWYTLAFWTASSLIQSAYLLNWFKLNPSAYYAWFAFWHLQSSYDRGSPSDMLHLRLCHLFMAAAHSDQFFVAGFLFSFLKLFRIPKDSSLPICKSLTAIYFLENELWLKEVLFYSKFLMTSFKRLLAKHKD